MNQYNFWLFNNISVLTLFAVLEEALSFIKIMVKRTFLQSVGRVYKLTAEIYSFEKIM